VLCLEVERLNQEDILSTFRDSLHSQQSNNSDLRDRLVQLERVEASLHEYAYLLLLSVIFVRILFIENELPGKQIDDGKLLTVNHLGTF